MTSKELYEDYLPDDSIFSEETKDMNRLKHIIFDQLDEPDRRIIILYTELQSVRQVGKMLGISPASAWIAINNVKKKIRRRYAKYND